MEFLVDCLHRFAFPVSGDGDGSAVRVGAGNHEDIVAFEAVIAGDDVAGEMRTGDIAHMDLGVSIRPGNGDEDVFRHKGSLGYLLAGSDWRLAIHEPRPNAKANR